MSESTIDNWINGLIQLTNIQKNNSDQNSKQLMVLPINNQIHELIN